MTHISDYSHNLRLSEIIDPLVNRFSFTVKLQLKWVNS